MPHETIPRTNGHCEMDFASLWPVGATAAPFPVAEAAATRETAGFAPNPSRPDGPRAVGAMIAFAYAALIGAFALATAGPPASLSMLVGAV